MSSSADSPFAGITEEPVIADRTSQGAKAAQKRARNKEKDAPKAASQLKTVSRFHDITRTAKSRPDPQDDGQNAAAMNIVCAQCRQTFLSTSRAPQLTLHAVNKHNATLPQCFPEFKVSEAK